MAAHCCTLAAQVMYVPPRPPVPPGCKDKHELCGQWAESGEVSKLLAGASSGAGSRAPPLPALSHASGAERGLPDPRPRSAT